MHVHTTHQQIHLLLDVLCCLLPADALIRQRTGKLARAFQALLGQLSLRV